MPATNPFEHRHDGPDPQIIVAFGRWGPGHLGELTRIISFDLVDAALAATGAVLRRVRDLQNPAPLDAGSGGWPAAAARRPKVVNLLLRIEREREAYLRFATDVAVPLTNNQAEGDLRGCGCGRRSQAAHRRGRGGVRGAAVLPADGCASGA